MVVVTKYILFREAPLPDKRTTKLWNVLNKSSNDPLGVIKWWGAWRQYCFFPDGDVLFSAGCLADIQAFINEQMKLRKSTASEKA